MNLKQIAKKLTTSTDSAIAKLVEKLVADEVKSPHAKLLIARLTKGGLAVAGKGATLAERLLDCTRDLFKLSEAVVQRRAGMGHLFAEGLTKGRANPSRLGYLRVVDDVGELAKLPNAAQAVTDAPVRKSAEALRNQLAENVGFGVFDCYNDLRRETSTLNALNRLLTPGEYPGGIQLDAHHLIEGRTYDRFAEDWKLLGWNSAGDMMATAIPWESHIRSTRSKKPLPGFEDRPDALRSLTDRLKKHIGEKPFDKYASVEQLIDAYVDFYRKPINYKGQVTEGSRTTQRTVAALETAKRELHLARTRAKLVSKAKKKD